MKRTTEPTPALASDLAERAGERTDDALRSVQQGIAELRDSVPGTLSRATATAEDLARRGIERARGAVDAVSESAVAAGDAARWRIKDEPVKAVLLAAALGAGAMLLVQWLRERRESRFARLFR